MSTRRAEGLFQSACAILALLIVAGCGKPAKVVLYEERHGRAAPPSSAPASAAAKPARRPPAASPAHPATHTVRSGDTVYTVATRYQVPIRGLIERNRLRAPYVLRSGQALRLPNPRRHVVRSGDTIYAISRTYDVALSRLVQVNGLAPPYTIVVGQTLRLPDSVEPERPVRSAVASKPLPDSGRRTAVPGKPRPGPKPTVAPRATPKSARQAAAPQRNRPAAVPKPPPLSSRKFLLPVRGRLLSRFGPKGRGLRNDGVNIAAPRGTPVRAAENGIVVYSGNALLGFGNMVLLRHANGYMTAYAHNDTVSVSRGDTVRRGQVIATVGSTGNVASPQLHFEIRKGKRAIDPAKYLPALAAAS